MTVHPQSTGLQYVVETVEVMKQLLRVMQGSVDLDTMSKEARDMIESMRGEKLEMKLDTLWKELQAHIDHVLDRDMKSGTNLKVCRAEISSDSVLNVNFT